jgi:hypothetical protein
VCENRGLDGHLAASSSLHMCDRPQRNHLSPSPFHPFIPSTSPLPSFTPQVCLLLPIASPHHSPSPPLASDRKRAEGWREESLTKGEE